MQFLYLHAVLFKEGTEVLNSKVLSGLDSSMSWFH